MNIAIIGAWAAGCFAAIQIKRNNPKDNVTVYEASINPLAKVAITGGGWRNLTNCKPHGPWDMWLRSSLNLDYHLDDLRWVLKF